MSLVELARPEIQALHAYAAAQQVDDTIRLNANESPRRDGDDRFRRPLNRYPEVRPQRYRQPWRHALAVRPLSCWLHEAPVKRSTFSSGASVAPVGTVF